MSNTRAHSFYEQYRLSRLQRLGILDTPPEERFDRITSIARSVYGTEIALVSLVDEDRQWFKSKQGIDVCSTERAIAICDHAIRQDDVFVVNDASKDARFADNCLVTGPLHLRFYAGMPIREPSGFKIGTLCVIDSQPKEYDSEGFEILKKLARLVESEIERGFGLDDCRVQLHPGRLSQAIKRAQNLVLGNATCEDTFKVLLNDIVSLTDAKFGLISHMGARPDEKIGMNLLAVSDFNDSAQGVDLNSALEQLGESCIKEGSQNIDLESQLGALLSPGGSENCGEPRPGVLSLPIVQAGQFAGLVCLLFDRRDVDPGLEDALAPLLHTVGVLVERMRLKHEQVLNWQKLQRRAERDELTGLLNRKGLTNALRSSVRDDGHQIENLCLYVLDIDNFGLVNEENGRAVGDQVLRHLARRLGTIKPEQCLLGRIGGDEFVLLVQNDPEREVYALIRETLAEGVNGLRIEASVGAAHFPEDSKEPEQLLRYALKALFDAKEKGKNRCEYFDLKAHENMQDVVAMREAVAAGLEKREFVMYYQPKVALDSRGIIGFETLIRWHSPDRGLVMPDQFLPAVQHTELDYRVGEFVIDEAIATLQRFDQQGLPYGLSINVSPQHFLRSEFVEYLEAALQGQSSSFCRRLTIEIIETTAIDDNSAAEQVIRRCQALGIKVSLDDFGTGFSSLSYFRQLPLDEVKIDRSFVFNLLSVPEDAIIVESVIALCQSFGRVVVAEGIESEAHARKLCELGCKVGQGYHYSKALPLAEVLDWAQNYLQTLSANDAAPYSVSEQIQA